MFVSLKDSKRWTGVTFPQPFPPDSVEFHVAKAFRSISGSFFKCTKKRKGVGKDRVYKLEPFVKEIGAMYGKLHAKTMIIYMPSSQVDLSAIVPTFVLTTLTVSTPTDPISMATSKIATIDLPAPVDPISMLDIENTTTLPTHGLGIPDKDLTELERLAINWENYHIAYYESMDFKEKIDKRKASASTSQVF